MEEMGEKVERRVREKKGVLTEKSFSKKRMGHRVQCAH